MQFKNIIGQVQLKQQLIQSVKSGRISHTQLFFENEGSGALPLAVAYSQFINCTNPTEKDSCGVCPSCVKFEKLVHPDLHFTFPTIAVDKKKTSNDFMEEWRNAFIANPYITELQWLLTLDEDGKKQGNITAEECRDIFKKTGLKSFEAKFKTVIIWMAEYLEKEGNILLKLLEEPPVGTLIILIANDTENVLPTILSRTQILKIPRLKDEDIMQKLIADFKLNEQEALTISRISEGNYSLAQSLVNTGYSDYFKLFSEWMRLCYTHQNSLEKLSKWIEDTVKSGREFLKSFISYSQQMMRAGLLFNFDTKNLLRISEDESEFMKRFSSFITPKNIPQIAKALDEASYHIERNADLKITFLELSLYIGSLIKSKT